MSKEALLLRLFGEWGTRPVTILRIRFPILPPSHIRPVRVSCAGLNPEQTWKT